MNPPAAIFPADVKALDGKHIRITGYMAAVDQVDQINHFSLQGNLFVCACGGPIHLQHTVYVKIANGKTIEFSENPIIVEGVLHVAERREEGYIIGLFDLDAASVRPAK